MMWELWTEYVSGNPQFSTAELKRPDPGPAGFSWVEDVAV
jgi:hypothetical protein